MLYFGLFYTVYVLFWVVAYYLCFILGCCILFMFHFGLFYTAYVLFWVVAHCSCIISGVTHSVYVCLFAISVQSDGPNAPNLLSAKSSDMKLQAG